MRGCWGGYIWVYVGMRRCKWGKLGVSVGWGDMSR